MRTLLRVAKNNKEQTLDHTGNELVGPLSEWVLEHVLVFFNLPDAGLILALGLVVIAIFVASVVCISLLSKARKLEYVNELLRDIEDKKDFSKANVYETLTAEVESVDLLRRAWQEFDETMVSPEEVESNFKGRGRYRLNTRRPHDYFNPQVITKANVQPWVHSSAFVGIGLLITFIGLVAALTEAATAFTADTGTGDEIEAAIGALLVVAGSKFFASIGGLIGSMLVAMGVHFGRSKISNAFAEMNALLEERLMFVSQTEASIAQYKYAVKQSEDLSAMKDELVTELGAQIGTQITEAVHAIPPLLKDALEPMSSSIGLMSEELVRNAQQTSGEVAQNAADNMLGAMQEGLATLGAQLRVMGENMEGLSGGLRDRLDGFNAAMTDMEGRQSGQSEKMVKELSDATVAMSEMFTRTLGAFENGFGGATERLAASAGQSADNFTGAYADMAGKLRDDVSDASAGIAASLKDNVDQILEGLRADLQSQGAELVNGVKALAEASEKTASSMGVVNDTLIQNQSALENSAKAVSEGGSSLQSAVADVAPLAKALSASAEQIDGAGKSASEAIMSLSADVAASKAAVEELREQWQRQGQLLEANDEQLTSAFRQVAEGSEASLQVLKESSEEIDKISSKVNEHFKSIVTELADAISDMSDNRRGH